MFLEWVIGLLVASLMGSIGHWIGYGVSFTKSIPTLLIFSAVALIGMTLDKLIKTPFPAFLWVCVVSVIFALPFMPTSKYLMWAIGNFKTMAVVTPILGFAGVTVGKNFAYFKKLSWKSIIVGILVIAGTWFWSALIAQIMLKITGSI